MITIFEVDYEEVWNYFLEGVREAAQTYPEAMISLEYKFVRTFGSLSWKRSQCPLHLSQGGFAQWG